MTFAARADHHQHLHVLAVGGQESIEHVLLWAPGAFGPSEVEVLRTAQVRQWALESLRLDKAEMIRAVCCRNLKNVGTSLEMWSSDHDGPYPESLSQLTPNLLRHIPVCPSGQSDSYSANYRKRSDPDHFVLHCSDDHSAAELSAGLPAYDSDFGLVVTESDRQANLARDTLGLREFVYSDGQ